MLYDDPDAFLICSFTRDNARCDPEPDATAPRQCAFQAGCGNTVRTGTHARRLRERADEIDRFVAALPGPMGRRLRANAACLRAMADNDNATAQIAEDLA